MALSVMILDFMLFGVAFGCCAGTLRTLLPCMSFARVYSLLRVVSSGAPGHGPVHLLLSSAVSLGFSWDSDSCVWLGLVCLLFARSLVLLSFFGRLFGTLGKLRLLVTLVLELVSGVVGIWTFVVP